MASRNNLVRREAEGEEGERICCDVRAKCDSVSADSVQRLTALETSLCEAHPSDTSCIQRRVVFVRACGGEYFRKLVILERMRTAD